jgi:pseudouridine synthase
MTEQPQSEAGGVRIAKFLAAAGLGSRRACEGLVTAGLVTVNGRPIDDLATRVAPGRDQVSCRGRTVEQSRNVYVVINKPAGCTCSARDTHAEKLVRELLPADLGRLFTVGRLDRDSEGLLILTNDGEWGNRLSHPRYEVPKTYHVSVLGRVDDRILRRFVHGIEDSGEFLVAQAARVVGNLQGGRVIELILTQGHKREIRRLCKRFHLRIVRLVRVAYGALELAGLETGCWRHLTAGEIRALEASSRKPRGASGLPGANRPPGSGRTTS